MKHFEAIIVGGGITGTAILQKLALKGVANTLLIEKGEKLGTGATGSWGSLVRAVHSCPQRTKRACESLPFYFDLKNSSANKHFSFPGSLYFLNKGLKKEFMVHIKTLEETDIEYELIDAEEGKKRFSDFEWYDGDFAIYEPNAGTACPFGVTEEMVNISKSMGAKAALGERVEKILVDKDSVLGVELKSGKKHFADQVILASGVWTLNLLKDIGVSLDLNTEVIQINRFRRHGSANPNPVFVDLASRTYGQGSPDGSLVGGYEAEMKSQPRSTNATQHLSLKDANFAKQMLARRLPWIRNSSVEGGLRALNCYSPNKPYVVERNDRFPNLIIATGMGCAGFTAAPYFAEAACELFFQQKKTSFIDGFSHPAEVGKGIHSTTTNNAEVGS